MVAARFAQGGARTVWMTVQRRYGAVSPTSADSCHTVRQGQAAGRSGDGWRPVAGSQGNGVATRFARRYGGGTVWMAVGGGGGIVRRPQWDQRRQNVPMAVGFRLTHLNRAWVEWSAFAVDRRRCAGLIVRS